MNIKDHNDIINDRLNATLSLHSLDELKIADDDIFIYDPQGEHGFGILAYVEMATYEADKTFKVYCKYYFEDAIDEGEHNYRIYCAPELPDWVYFEGIDDIPDLPDLPDLPKEYYNNPTFSKNIDTLDAVTSDINIDRIIRRLVFEKAKEKFPELINGIAETDIHGNVYDPDCDMDINNQDEECL